MRIGCLQFAPVRGDVAHNMTRADRILRRVDKVKPYDFKYDLLVLPKMAFTGSKFGPLEKLDAFLEPAAAGATSLWALTTTRRYSCAVAVGYPQRINITSGKATGARYFTSSIMVDAEGAILAHNTGIDSDERHEAFSDCTVPNVGKVSIGVFTDLNEKEFSSPLETGAYAYHMLASNTHVGIVCMTWETIEDRGKFFSDQEEPDIEALSCWATRLKPSVRAKRERETFIILCNRSGWQDDITYAGTSAVLGIKDGEVLVYGLLGGGVDDLLVVDTDSDPFARLRPHGSQELSSESELENASSGGTASSQAEPHTPDTPCRQCLSAQEHLRKHMRYAEAVVRKRNAFPEARVHKAAVTLGPSVVAKK